MQPDWVPLASIFIKEKRSSRERCVFSSAADEQKNLKKKIKS